MNSNYKNRIFTYLQETLGFSVSLEKFPDTLLKELPLYLKYSNEYFNLDIDDHRLILILSKDKTSKTAFQLKKQARIVAKVTGKKVVFGLEVQSSQLRKRMIQEKINFIIPGTRLYLPDLLTDIKEINRPPQPFSESLTPSSQFLLIYHLLIETLDTFSFKEIAQKTGYTPKTITKIASELKEKDICTITGTKEKRFFFDLNRKQLWKTVESGMQSPIHKILCTNQKGYLPFCKSGGTALYHYFALSAPEKEAFAVYRPEFEAVNENEYWDFLDEMEGDIQIEIWKYNPSKLSKNGYIDPISLYLCHKDSNDELIKVELRGLIQNNLG